MHTHTHMHTHMHTHTQAESDRHVACGVSGSVVPSRHWHLHHNLWGQVPEDLGHKRTPGRHKHTQTQQQHTVCVVVVVVRVGVGVVLEIAPTHIHNNDTHAHTHTHTHTHQVVEKFKFKNPVYTHAMSVSSTHTLAAVGGGECKVTLCDLVSGASTHVLESHLRPVMSLAWSTGREHVLASGRCVCVCVCV